MAYEGYDSEITDDVQRGKLYAAWTEFRDKVGDDPLCIPDLNSFRAAWMYCLAAQEEISNEQSVHTE